MKTACCLLLFLFMNLCGNAQASFTGIADYRMARVGGSDEDSIVVVFDRDRIAVTIYRANSSSPGGIDSITMIHDLGRRRITIANRTDRRFFIDTLRSESVFRFVDTKRMATASGSVCFHYRADSTAPDRAVTRADCLASIDYVYPAMGDFWCMGLLPFVVDGRIVMDYIITEPNGSKPRIYLKKIERRENVDGYFDLSGFKPMK